MYKYRKLTSGISQFLRQEVVGGIIMTASIVLAMTMANNSYLYAYYNNFVHYNVEFNLLGSKIEQSLHKFIDDGLMTLFFLLVSIELKQEIFGLKGKAKQAILPIIAAITGMLVPMSIFFAINYNHPENWRGFGVPSATDIAFSVCVLMLVAKNIPKSVKIFLLAIAIFDDLGAIALIAIFYNKVILSTSLIFAFVLVLILWLMNYFKIKELSAYLLIGGLLCFFFNASGLHSTIGAVILGMLIPLGNYTKDDQSFIKILTLLVNILILPLFAFVASGIDLTRIELSYIFDPLVLGIALGLFFGKQIGIFFSTKILVKAHMASLPEGATWLQIYGVSILAGIGFTMSLFIGNLAFEDVQLQEHIKLGVIIGSLASAITGAIVLKLANKKSNLVFQA